MKKTLSILEKFLRITLGAAFYAIGTAFFVNPHNLAPGGLTGIAIIVNRAVKLLCDCEIPVGIFVLVLNVPLLIVGLIKFGRSFLLGTVYGTVVLSVLISLSEKLQVYLAEGGYSWIMIESPIIAGLAGGALMALGLGTVFKAGATTGGTDIIVKLLRLKYRHIRTGRIFLIIDSIICISSLPVVGWKIETVLYSILSMLVCSYVLDIVLYGMDGAKLVYIVSDRTDEIAARLLKDLNVGATFLDGIGAYTKEKKEVIMVAVKKHVYPKLKDVVTEEDPKAFLIVSSASEVFGEGYKSHFKKDM